MKPCTLVLCYREGSDCCDLRTGHLHKPMSTGFMEKATSPSYLQMITIHTSGCPDESAVLLSSSVHLQEAPKKKKSESLQMPLPALP